MSVYTYNLQPQDVLERMPRASALYISATSIPLSLQHLEDFIQQGSARVNAALEQRGIIAAADMNEADHARLSALVIDYAIAEALFTLEGGTSTHDEAQQKFNSGFAEITNRPQQLVSAPNTRYSNTTSSKIQQRAGLARDTSGNGLGAERYTFIGLDSRDMF